MDSRLRRAARQAPLGPEQQAELLRQRLRAGELDPELVGIAARLGSALATALLPDALPTRSCDCHQTKRIYCARCGGSGTQKMPDNLIPAAMMMAQKIGHSRLGQWAMDCVEHVAQRFEQRHPGAVNQLRVNLTRARTAAFSAHRNPLIDIVSDCYQMAGCRVEERQWQTQRLCELLLGV